MMTQILKGENMSEFNFKSQICTDRVQSEHLLALGLKKETADMCYAYCNFSNRYETQCRPPRIEDIPAWSLGRLLELMPSSIKGFYHFSLIYNIENNTVGYVSANGVSMQSFKGVNIFDNVVYAISWLIKEGYFNKEYLV